MLVVAKLAVLALFVGIALAHFSASHFHPFAPRDGWSARPPRRSSSLYRHRRGFDRRRGGERNPRRNLPLAIILSLLIVTAAYILVAVAALGAQPWTSFAGQEAGLAVILRNLTGQGWPAVLLSLGRSPRSSA